MKRVLAFVTVGLAIPSVALAAELAASCCGGACCLFGCPLC